MKKSYYIPFILSFVFLFSACKKEEITPDPPPPDVTLNLSVTNQPDGGNQVNTVSCEYDGSVSVSDESIQVTVEWWWEDGNHENAALKDSEQVTFDSKNTVSKSTVYSAGSGYVLLNYYWVKFKWTDDDGSHEIESGKAYCTNTY